MAIFDFCKLPVKCVNITVKMASNVFDDSNLFSEFEKERPPCDDIIKQSCANRKLADQPVRNRSNILSEASGDDLPVRSNTKEHIRRLEDEIRKLKAINILLDSSISF